MIDAGSSGSRVHVYRWPQSTAGRVESTPGAVKSLRPTLKIRVGLATDASDLTVVRQQIERLLINASRIVPPELQQFTPVYFMATAGKQSVSLLIVHSFVRFISDSETSKQIKSSLNDEQWIDLFCTEMYYVAQIRIHESFQRPVASLWAIGFILSAGHAYEVHF